MIDEHGYKPVFEIISLKPIWCYQTPVHEALYYQYLSICKFTILLNEIIIYILLENRENNKNFIVEFFRTATGLQSKKRMV